MVALFSFPITTLQSTLSTAPLYGSLTNASPLGELTRSVGVVAFILRPFFSCWRPMVAATFIFRRGGHWPPVFSFQNFVRDGALDVPFIAIFPFPTFQHVKASRYGLPYLLICCTCVGRAIRCFLSVTAAETRI